MSEEIDKGQLYGDFREEQARRGKLAHRMAHKALDIPEDDMQIHAPKTETTNINGVGTKGLIGIVGIPAAAAAIIAAALLFKGHAQTEPPPATPQAPPAAAKKADEYEAVYWQRQPNGSWKEIKREPLKTGGNP